MEGYTTINIKGREVGLLFGLYAIQRIFEKLGGLSTELTESRKNLQVYKHILYSGYLCDREAMDEPVELTPRDFQVWIEGLAKNGDLSEVTRAILVYNKSTEVKVKEVAEDEKKNHLIGMI